MITIVMLAMSASLCACMNVKNTAEENIKETADAVETELEIETEIETETASETASETKQESEAKPESETKPESEKEETGMTQGNKPEINEETVICSACGLKTYARMKFCTECGAPLIASDSTVEKPVWEENQIAGGPAGFAILETETKTEDNNYPPEYVNDQGLTIIADYCKKTVATVGGDGYSEAVLYESPDKSFYEVHTYSKYVSDKEEIHHAYHADKAFADQVMKLIYDQGIPQWEGQHGYGLAGGEYVVKFQKDGKLVRISTDNTPMDGAAKLITVGNLLYTKVYEENKVREGDRD